MKKRNFQSLFFLAAAASFAIVSCNKTFDAPPLYIAPTLNANKTIAALKSVYTTTGKVVPITDTTIISGIVVGNDKSGNIYKVLYIQDATGGLALKLNATNLYASYPVGMQIFIKCNGLALSDYNGDMEIGSIDNTTSTPALTGIPSSLISQYIVAGNLNSPIIPKVVTLAQLNATSKLAPYLDTLQNTLLQINNVEFASTDTGYVYADTSAAKGSVQRNLEDCSGNKSIFYNSGYASFAGVKIPKGNGTVLAICTPYKSSSELILRDTSDVQLNGTRCGGGSVTPPPALTSGLVSIATLRSAFTGNGIKLNSSQQITGVVISDASAKNINKNTVVIQQGNSGISIYFSGSTVAFNLGDSITVDISSDSLISYPYTGGSLEVKGTTAQFSGTTVIASGKTVTPQVLTIAQLNTSLGLPLNDPGNYEYTLVQIANATVSPSGNYYTKSVYPNLADGTATIELFTTSTATFGASAMPTSAKTWIGFGNTYKGFPEFQIRNLNDVQ